MRETLLDLHSWRCFRRNYPLKTFALEGLMAMGLGSCTDP